MANRISIAALDGSGSFDAYVAEPANPARTAVIVLQEVFGINAGIRDKCDALAAEGHLALAPDLFWRIEPGIELDPDTQLQQALDLFPKFDQQKGVEDIEATIREARAKVKGGKVGAVGYCLGGRLAYMTATRTDIDASVGYYGVGIDGLLNESHAISRPLMLHIPTADGFVPPDVQKRMHEGLDRHPRVTLHDYEGLDHGFATQFGKRRNDEAAKLADSRTSAFFAEHLA
jgi:carboxymethylenebutenolidase